jgi:hypothetical protein
MAEPLDPKALPEKLPPPPAPKIKFVTRIRRVITAPFAAVVHLVHGKSKIDEIVVYSAPPAFYLWIVIAVGFGLKPLVPELVS